MKLALAWLLLILAGESMGQSTISIATFEGPPDVLEWTVLTDAVRPGGKSTGALLWVPEAKKARFRGRLELNADGDGFSSIRLDGAWNCEGALAIHLNVEGEDGREYRLLLKDAHALGAPETYTYQQDFQVPQGTAAVIRLPESQFRAVRRGKPFQAPPLDWSHIREVGIQMNDGTNGDFSLKISEIWIEKASQ